MAQDDIYAPVGTVPQVPNISDVNIEERTPCIILVDCSYSMIGAPMKQVNDGLKEFEKSIKIDPLTAARVVISVVAFGVPNTPKSPKGVELIQEWIEAQHFSAPSLTASGSTPMGEAVNVAIDEIARIKPMLRSRGITYKRPWLFLLTDGQPNDSGWEVAADRCAQSIKNNEFVFWALTTDESDTAALHRFGGQGQNVFGISGADLRSMFVWLSSSMKAASGAAAGDSVQVIAPGRVLDIPT